MNKIKCFLNNNKKNKYLIIKKDTFNNKKSFDKLGLVKPNLKIGKFKYIKYIYYNKLGYNLTKKSNLILFYYLKNILNKNL